MKLEIVSGGQTGVDRAALDTAIRYDLPCGGWCPPGRLAEDGPISTHYPLTELPSGGYPQRTRFNVKDADATLIIHGGKVGRGTGLTINTAQRLDKPLLVLNLQAYDANSDFSLLQTQLREFIDQQQVAVLNVAGPRASGWSNAYALSRKLLAAVFADYRSRL